MADALPKEISDKLYGVLKSWSEDMDPLRYEAYARRLVAAEHGRPDAVEWAQAWHSDLLAEESQKEAVRQAELREEEARTALAQAEFKAGRCSNPNYQAFLDTIEQPELIESNAPYFEWLSRLTARFEGTPAFKGLPAPERKAAWQKLLRDEGDANLAPRLRSISEEAKTESKGKPKSGNGPGF